MLFYLAEDYSSGISLVYRQEYSRKYFWSCLAADTWAHPRLSCQAMCTKHGLSWLLPSHSQRYTSTHLQSSLGVPLALCDLRHSAQLVGWAFHLLFRSYWSPRWGTQGEVTDWCCTWAGETESRAVLKRPSWQTPHLLVMCLPVSWCWRRDFHCWWAASMP